MLLRDKTITKFDDLIYFSSKKVRKWGDGIKQVHCGAIQPKEHFTTDCDYRFATEI